jgi:hypothetical protein
MKWWIKPFKKQRGEYLIGGADYWITRSKFARFSARSEVGRLKNLIG